MTIERARAMLAEHASSSETVKSFCARVGIPVGQYYYWRRRCAEVSSEQEQSRFIPVSVKADASVKIRLGQQLEFECTNANVDLVAELLQKLSVADA